MPDSPVAEGEAQPVADHLGHRARLRTRFLETGGEGFADYELLEMLLMLSIPRRDVKPLAKALLKRFETFAGVVSATSAQLSAIDGIADNTIAALKLIQAASLRLLKQQVMNRPVLSSWEKLNDYLTAGMAHQSIEQFRILFLDKRNTLIADEVQQSGTVDHTPVYPREVVKRALEVGSTAIIIVHNHPSGDPTPSRADIEMTRQLMQAATALGITIHDHLIVGRTATTSFKSLGLL